MSDATFEISSRDRAATREAAPACSRAARDADSSSARTTVARRAVRARSTVTAAATVTTDRPSRSLTAPTTTVPAVAPTEIARSEILRRIGHDSGSSTSRVSCSIDGSSAAAAHSTGTASRITSTIPAGRYAAVETTHDVESVADDLQEHRGREERVREDAEPRCDDQPNHDADEGDAGREEGDGRRLLLERDRLGSDRPEDEHPHDRAEPDSDDRRVEDRSPVVRGRPQAHEDDQPRCEERVRGEPQEVGRPGEGDVRAGARAGRDRQLGRRDEACRACDQPPRPPIAGAVEPSADQHADGCDQGDAGCPERPRVAAAEQRDGGRDRHDHADRDPVDRAHLPSIGAEGAGC